MKIKVRLYEEKNSSTRFSELSKKPYYRGFLYKLEQDHHSKLSGFSYDDIIDAMKRANNKKISITKEHLMKSVIIAPVDEYLLFKNPDGSDKKVWVSYDPLTEIYWVYDKISTNTALFIAD